MDTQLSLRTVVCKPECNSWQNLSCSLSAILWVWLCHPLCVAPLADKADLVHVSTAAAMDPKYHRVLAPKLQEQTTNYQLTDVGFRLVYRFKLSRFHYDCTKTCILSHFSQIGTKTSAKKGSNLVLPYKATCE